MIENAICTVIGFGLALAVRITNAPLPDVQRPSDDAFQYARRPAPRSRWNVWGWIIGPVIRFAAKQWRRS